MIKNMGNADRIIRAGIFIVIIILAIQTMYWWLYLIALVILITIFMGYCPIYQPLKIDTRNAKEKK